MSTTDLNWIANYIWGIADDVLRDLYVRGKYRDVILPMTVLRRLDAVWKTANGLSLTCRPASTRQAWSNRTRPCDRPRTGILQHLEVHPARP